MAGIPPSNSTGAASSSNGRTYGGPFSIMTVLFFMWGVGNVAELKRLLLEEEPLSAIPSAIAFATAEAFSDG